MRNKLIDARIPAFVVLIGAISAGCGSNPYQNTARVTGRVTCSGQPATGGVIVFTPVDDPAKTGRKAGEPGRPSSARVAEDGSFTLMLEKVGSEAAARGALVGPHTVSFQVPQKIQKIKLHASVYRRAKPEEIARLEAQLNGGASYPPLNCGNSIQPTSVVVASGKNNFTFELGPAPEEPAVETAKEAPRSKAQRTPEQEQELQQKIQEGKKSAN